MGKFNLKSPGVKTVNREGHAAYSMKEKDRLVTHVLTTFFNEPEFPISDGFDYSGWDLRKTLFLLNKSNPVLFEWLKSPVVYFKDDLSCVFVYLQ